MTKPNDHDDDSNSTETPWEQYQARFKDHQHQRGTALNRILSHARFHVEVSPKLVKFAFVLFILMVGLASLGYLASPLSRVATKTVNGTNHLSENAVVDSIPVKKGASVISIMKHRSRLERQFLKRNPKLKAATLRVHDWNHVTFDVKEYGVAGYLYSKKRYYIVVDNGEIINRYQDSPASNKPIFANFKPNNNLKSITVQYKRLPSTIRNNIVQIKQSKTAYDEQRLKIMMRDKNIVFAKSSTFYAKMSYYPSIVDKIKKPSVINLEVGAYSYPIKNKK